MAAAAADMVTIVLEAWRLPVGVGERPKALPVCVWGGKAGCSLGIVRLKWGPTVVILRPTVLVHEGVDGGEGEGGFSSET